MKYEIKNRITGLVQFTADIDSTEDAPRYVKIGLSVKWALKSGANLYGADLYGADLHGADLHGANLIGADLHGADLRGANLIGANLIGANLIGANLSGAYLSGAYLGRANLVDGGQRFDGYRFVGWIKDGVLQIRAGCRNFTISEARAHWSSASYPDARLGAESLLILDRIERTAEVRGMITITEAE